MDNLKISNNDYLNNFKLTTSTPGKILICGGYLIINPNYSGLVFTTNTKFNCSSKLISNNKFQEDYNKDNKLFTKFLIQFNSLNFNLYFTYEVIIHLEEIHNLKFEINQISGEENNFIFNSILTSINFFLLENYLNENVLSLFRSILNDKVLEIKIDSDYRFYTYNEEEFNNNKNRSFAIKTGLGSSSALICSVVSNIYIFLNIITRNIDIDAIKLFNFPIKNLVKDKLANILLASYFANNLAQNKIGSGFDIQSCLIGSHIFKRHMINENLNQALNLNSSHQNEVIINQNAYDVYSELSKQHQSEVISEINYIKYPKFFKSCLISIECGSDTRILVSKVMKWAELNKTKEIFDDELFQSINKNNIEIINLFTYLSAYASNISEEEFINSFKNDNNNKNDIKIKCNELRKNIKVLSKSSGIEIEPEIFSVLIDDLLIEDNILFAICPGAGGFDSVFVMGLYDNFKNNVEDAIERFNMKNDNFKAFYLPIDIDELGTVIVNSYNI